MKAAVYIGVAAPLLTACAAQSQVHALESPRPKSGAPAVQPMDGTGVPGRGIPPAASLAESGVFRYEHMPVRTAANGSESRMITHGTLRTGESVNLHESAQPAGTAAPVLHVIQHTEFICVQQGVLTFDHVDGSGNTVSETVGPGSVIYVAEGTQHRVRNGGTETAKYFVIAIGGDAK